MFSRFAVWSSGPRVQIILNSVLAVVFLAMIPVTLITGLKQSVPFLVSISLWALVAAHWSSALAALAAKVGAEQDVKEAVKEAVEEGTPR